MSVEDGYWFLECHSVPCINDRLGRGSERYYLETRTTRLHIYPAPIVHLFDLVQESKEPSSPHALLSDLVQANVWRYEALCVVAVICTVVANQIMRQLMTQNAPPIHQSICPCLSTLSLTVLQELRFMQLLEIQIIAKYAPVTVKGDCFPAGFEKDIHAPYIERKNR